MNWGSWLVSSKYRTTEFILLFLAVPALFLIYDLSISPIPILLLVSIYAVFILLYKNKFEFVPELSNVPPTSDFYPVLMLFIPATIITVGVCYYFLPNKFLRFVSEEPEVWLSVMLIYPIFSVLPQEFLFRTFFFQRYGDFFKNPTLIITLSAVTFSYSHIIFRNVVAPVLTLPAGCLFAWRYYKTRSFYLVVVEHTLYGWFIFTVGLGAYFWHGAM